MAARELKFFSAALSGFVKSTAKFQVVCTALSNNASSQIAAIQPHSPPAKLVVLDSSFNPPTVAHMQMATSAIQSLSRGPPSTCRILLLLSVNNADKAPKPAAFEHRLAMMYSMAKDMQALLKQDGLSATDDVPVDIGLTGQPYFHDKSNAIAESEFYSSSKSPSETEQIFLVGYDTLIRIFDPKYYSAPASGLLPNQTPMQCALSPFLQRARLRVTTRPDDQWGSEDTQKAWLHRLSGLGGNVDWAAKVDLISGEYKGENVVSSTVARRAAKEKNWPGLAAFVGPSVLSWLESQKLYSD